jgi:hypothetical protein
VVVQFVVSGQQVSWDFASESRALYRRLGPFVPFIIPVSTVLALLTTVGLHHPLLIVLAMLGYMLIGAWFGALAFSQRHQALIDKLFAIGAVFSALPVVGPWALLGCVWELDLGSHRDNVRRLLFLHAAFASLAGVVFYLLRPLEFPALLFWRTIVSLLVLAAGICLWRTWKAMPDPPPSR